MRQKGFTLVELLVAIGIIGILSSIAVVSVGNVRAKARDAKRVGDIKQIQTALESYFNDQNQYPATPIGVEGGVLGGQATNALCTTLAKAVEGENPAVAASAGFKASASCTGTVYLNPVPTNPTPKGTAYTYALVNNEYSITFSLESGSGTLTGGNYTATPNGIVKNP